MENKIMVSICCLAYNHEHYIADAIEGFLNQKTKFNYEIIIHEDASTDTTKEIIKEYEMKYPDMIKPIYQSENQYSKGVNPVLLLQEQVRGKYVAICEGDDYWLDAGKLQKQIEYMEENPTCTFCFHNGYVKDENSNKGLHPIVPWMPENHKMYSNKNRRYNAGELQLLGYIPTGSFLFPKTVIDNPPQWFFEAPVLDNAIKLLATSKGYAYYMNDLMCVYRFNVPDSVTTKWSEESKEQIVHRCNGFIKLLNNFNEYTNKEFDKEMELAKLTWEIQKYTLNENYQELKNRKYNNYLKLLNGKERWRALISMRYPLVVNYYRKWKNHSPV